MGIKSYVLVGGGSIGEEEVSGGLLEILRDYIRRCLHKQISCWKSKALARGRDW